MTHRSTLHDPRAALAVALFSTLTAGVFVACGNDDGGGTNTDGGTGQDAGAPCTPLDPTFTVVHGQILSQQGCARSACHETNTVAGGGAGRLDLALDKDGVYNTLLNDMTDASDVRATIPKRVVANDLAQSFLWRKVADDDPPGIGSRMPQGCSPRFPAVCLTQCELDAIQGWIEAGAPNN